MPAFNEAKHIVSNLKEVVRVMDGFGCEYEVIVVDDGSPDNTYLHAARLLVDHSERVRIVRYDRNEGKGNALTCGSCYASGDVVVFLDADMDLHPMQLPFFFEILETGADAVIGSKWHPLSNIEYPWLRRLYSIGYFMLVRLLFGLPVRDTQTGLKVFRAELLESVLPRLLCKRFAFDIELLANAHRYGFRVVDAPVSLQFQRSMGRIKWNDVFNIFSDTFAIFWRMRVLRYYDRSKGALSSLNCYRQSRLIQGVPAPELALHQS